VLVPLAEIAADWLDPVSQNTVGMLGDRLNHQDIKPL
jgi:7,8-dihydro-6-hydroxymethylpterin-pyrophosphokinase